MRWVPPPTRGWSPFGRAFRRMASGSPAHAGMVPGRQKQLLRRRRFPRPRGDGPVSRSCGTDPTWVPPPTRGWSPVGIAVECRGSGSPAHAGMVPSRTRKSQGRRRFPRPRGDGPSMTDRASLSCSVPPPTRGWSRRRRLHRALEQGSPALAAVAAMLFGIMWPGHHIEVDSLNSPTARPIPDGLNEM